MGFVPASAGAGSPRPPTRITFCWWHRTWWTASSQRQPRITNCKPASGLIHHTDQGSQYASHDYRKALDANGMACSMSRKGNCWDNAVAESFFSMPKTELSGSSKTHQDARRAIFEYIEVFLLSEKEAFQHWLPHSERVRGSSSCAHLASPGISTRAFFFIGGMNAWSGGVEFSFPSRIGTSM